LTGGHNWQVNTTVLGIEADFNYFGVRESISSTGAFPLGRAIDAFTITSSVSSDWLITLRPRGGVLVTPSLLLYGTGGLAVANAKGNFNFSSPFSGAVESGSIDSIRYGWTAGAGGEYALMNGWSIKAEYLHVDLGRSTAISTNMTAFFVPVAFPTDVFSHSVSLRSEIVRVGLNYKFGGPIVAKY
jgi:outer membrane immunogenic protein